MQPVALRSIREAGGAKGHHVRPPRHAKPSDASCADRSPFDARRAPTCEAGHLRPSRNPGSVTGLDGAQVSAATWGTMLRENEYLKGRCAQLQEDVTNLAAALDRARPQLARADAARRSRAALDPLSGGQ